MTFTVNREALAWAAGIFEGEGCFSASTASKGRALSATLTSTDRDVIDRFHQVIGFGRIRSVSPSKQHPTWKPKFTWNADSFEEVQAVMAMLWPWLHARRRSKIQSLLKAFHKSEPQQEREHRERIAKVPAIRKALAHISTRPLHGRRWLPGPTQEGIARQFGVSPAYVTAIKQGKVAA